MPDENVLTWLLEPSDPGVRYLALRDLLERPDDDNELKPARRAAHEQGPIAQVLKNMHPDGYWAKPGPGYSPKYRSTVWSLILLGQLGASVNEDARIATACEYLLRPRAGTWRAVLQVYLQVLLPGRSIACRATCVERCSPWGMKTRAWMVLSNGWHAL